MECIGTGRTVDPYVSSMCDHCYAAGAVLCPRCSGNTKIVTPAAERPCPGCQAKGTFPCPLCAGSGRLDSILVGGKDVRHLSTVQLRDAQKSVQALIRRIESAEALSVAATRPSEEADGFFKAVQSVVPLPANQLGRLDAVLAARDPNEAGELGYPFEASSYLSALSTHLERQVALIERGLWLLSRNEHGVPRLPSRKAGTLEWSSWFGEDKADKSVSYSLLGRGCIRTPHASNTDEVIRAWFKAHPEAEIIQVSSIPGFVRLDPNARMVHVWVVDQGENLGLHLVRAGCVPGGTMVAFRPEIDVEFATYFKFMKDVTAAETEAKTAKRGLWEGIVAKRAAASHQKAARKLQEEGKFAEAVEEYRRAIDAGDTEAQTLLSLGECLERLNRFDDALEVYERAIGDGRWWPPYLSKAQCLEKRDGVKPAVAWLEGLPTSSGDRMVPYLIACFHDEGGRPKEAIPHYERVVKLVREKHGFKFDDQGSLVLDSTTLEKDTNDLAELWPTLEDLASCYWKTGQADLALKTATMGIAVGRAIDRDKSYLSKDRIESGNILCRIVRARVYHSRGMFDEARRELRFAKIGNENGYPPWAAEITELETKLESSGTDSR